MKIDNGQMKALILTPSDFSKKLKRKRADRTDYDELVHYPYYRLQEETDDVIRLPMSEYEELPTFKDYDFLVLQPYFKLPKSFDSKEYIIFEEFIRQWIEDEKLVAATRFGWDYLIAMRHFKGITIRGSLIPSDDSKNISHWMKKSIIQYYANAERC